MITRAFTAGPGDYDLFVAWADPRSAKPAPTVRVVTKSLHAAAGATHGAHHSSVILADSVGVAAAPYPPAEQAAHPYSIGLTEIVPARDAIFTRRRAACRWPSR